MCLLLILCPSYQVRPSAPASNLSGIVSCVARLINLIVFAHMHCMSIHMICECYQPDAWAQSVSLFILQTEYLSFHELCDPDSAVFPCGVIDKVGLSGSHKKFGSLRPLNWCQLVKVTRPTISAIGLLLITLTLSLIVAAWLTLASCGLGHP